MLLDCLADVLYMVRIRAMKFVCQRKYALRVTRLGVCALAERDGNGAIRTKSSRLGCMTTRRRPIARAIIIILNYVIGRCICIQIYIYIYSVVSAFRVCTIL